MSSANAFNLDQSKKLSFGKELDHLQTPNKLSLLTLYSIDTRFNTSTTDCF